MFPLLKDPSSSITLVLPCTFFFTNKFYSKSYHTYRIYTVAMKWRYPEKKQIVSKSHTNIGKLYYANEFSYAQTTCVQSLESVGWQCSLHPLYSGTKCGPHFHIWGLYLCIYELGKGEWPPDFFFFQSNCDTYLWTKEKTKSSQILQFHINTSQHTSLCLLALPLCRLQWPDLAMLSSCKFL